MVMNITLNWVMLSVDCNKFEKIRSRQFYRDYKNKATKKVVVYVDKPIQVLYKLDESGQWYGTEYELIEAMEQRK